MKPSVLVSRLAVLTLAVTGAVCAQTLELEPFDRQPDPVMDPATCLDAGAGTVAECSDKGNIPEIQVDSYRERAEGLGAEKSTQYSLGLVWDATDWLNLTVDYWNIKIEDRIAFFSSQKFIDIDNGDDPTPMPGAPCPRKKCSTGWRRNTGPWRSSLSGRCLRPRSYRRYGSR